VRRSASRSQAEAAELRGGEAAEYLSRRRPAESRAVDRRHRCPDDVPLDLAGEPGLDQLAADRPQQ